MAKYRPLSLEELQELETEFVNYLILNGIIAEDWEKLKKEEPSKASHIIELFSDMVFETILRKIRFLEFREPKEIRTFQCLDEKLVMVGMKADPSSDADFTDPSYIQRSAQNASDRLNIYFKEKAYTKTREQELFEMTEAGCLISDGKLFKTLSLAIPK